MIKFRANLRIITSEFSISSPVNFFMETILFLLNLYLNLHMSSLLTCYSSLQVYVIDSADRKRIEETGLVSILKYVAVSVISVK